MEKVLDLGVQLMKKCCVYNFVQCNLWNY